MPGQNSADPDQTAPRSSLIRVYTVCHSACIVWTHYSMVEPHSSNFRVVTIKFWVSEYLGNLRYVTIYITNNSPSARELTYLARDTAIFRYTTINIELRH